MGVLSKVALDDVYRHLKIFRASDEVISNAADTISFIGYMVPEQLKDNSRNRLKGRVFFTYDGTRRDVYGDSLVRVACFVVANDNKIEIPKYPTTALFIGITVIARISKVGA